MEPMPTVSVVVPAHDNEEHIGACLDSIVRQRPAPSQIIVVDDGSTDATGNILDHIYARMPGVTVIHQAQGGPAAARNRGFAEATGDYVLFVDADDLLLEGALSATLSTAQREDADIVVFAHADFDAAGPIPSRPQRFPADGTRESFLRFSLTGNANVLIWQRIYRTEALRRLSGPFNEAFVYGEDTVFTIDAASVASRFAYEERVCYLHRHHDRSLMARPKVETALSYLEIAQLVRGPLGRKLPKDLRTVETLTLLNQADRNLRGVDWPEAARLRDSVQSLMFAVLEADDPATLPAPLLAKLILYRLGIYDRVVDGARRIAG